MVLLTDFFTGEHWFRNLIVFFIAVLSFIVALIRLYYAWEQRKQTRHSGSTYLKKAKIIGSDGSRIKQSGMGSARAEVKNANKSEIIQN